MQVGQFVPVSIISQIRSRVSPASHASQLASDPCQSDGVSDDVLGPGERAWRAVHLLEAFVRQEQATDLALCTVLSQLVQTHKSEEQKQDPALGVVLTHEGDQGVRRKGCVCPSRASASGMSVCGSECAARNAPVAVQDVTKDLLPQPIQHELETHYQTWTCHYPSSSSPSPMETSREACGTVQPQTRAQVGCGNLTVLDHVISAEQGRELANTALRLIPRFSEKAYRPGLLYHTYGAVDTCQALEARLDPFLPSRITDEHGLHWTKVSGYTHHKQPDQPTHPGHPHIE